MSTTIKVAVIPGDGIGKEVMPEGMRSLEAAGAKHGIDFEWTEFDWSCETYLATGRMMPEDGIDQLRPFDACRWISGRSGSRIALGIVNSDPPRVRPTHQLATCTSFRRRALPAGGSPTR